METTMRWDVLAVALCFFASCSDQNMGAADMGGGVGDLSGVGDMSGGDLSGGGGGSGLELLAGQIGGLGLADRVGTAARFYDISNITADGAGKIYVAETSVLGYVRQITESSAAVTTLSGRPGAQHMVSDGAGNLYFTASLSFHGVKKLALASGTVSVLAGGSSTGSSDGNGPSAGFNVPRSIAMAGGILYVADRDNHTIRKIVAATGDVTTLAGSAGTSGSADGTGAAALFMQPSGVAVDGSGNVYVADTGNHTIRKIVAATGAVTTLAGSAGMAGSVDGSGTAARFSSPLRLTWDGAGNLYVAGNNTIRQLAIASGAVTTLAGVGGMAASSDGTGSAARFRTAADVTWAGNGTLYVADGITVRKIVVSTREVSTFAGLDASPGSADGTGAAARFRGPRSGMAADDDGNLYVPDVINAVLRKIVVASGAVSTISTSGTVSSISGGVTWDGAGNLYIAQTYFISKLVLSSGAMTTIAGAPSMPGSVDGTGAVARFNDIRNITWDGAGKLFVADLNNQTIRQIVAATGEVTTIAGSAGMSGSLDGTGPAARFNFPIDAVSDKSGNLYVADQLNRTLRKVVTATGVVTTLTSATDSSVSPQDVELDGAGNLYTADIATASGIGEGQVRKIVLATGQVTRVLGVPGQLGVFLGPLPAGLNGRLALGLGWVPNQGLAISDYAENAILLGRGL